MHAWNAVAPALLWLAIAAASAHASVTIRGIHSSTGEGYTRVVIDLSASTRFQYGFVPAGAGKPSRVYVDVHDVALEDRRGEVISINDGRVSRVRTGQYQARVARIVLELDTVVTPKVLAVEDPPRIVVDLAGPALPVAPIASGQDSRKVVAPQTAPARTGSGTATTAAAERSPSGGGAVSAKTASAPPSMVTRAPAPPSRGASPTPAPPFSAGRGTGLAPVQSAANAGSAQQPRDPSSAARPATGVTGGASGQKAGATGAKVTSAAQASSSAPRAVAPNASTPPVTPGRGTGLKVIPPRVLSDPARKARPIRIVIDAGHGGKDPGAKGPIGYEKDSVLDIAKRLAAKLASELNVEVHMTRTSDVYVPLDQRKDLANRVEADMFISIHANASRNNKLFGIETYYLKNTNDRATLRLARLENGVDMLIKGSDVSTDADLNYILSDIIQGQKEADSILLANHIQTQLCGHLDRSYDAIRNIGVKQGPFLVLDGTYMPAVLVEAGFITHNSEGRRLGAGPYQESVAEGLFRGIKAYLEDDRVNDLI